MGSQQQLARVGTGAAGSLPDLDIGRAQRITGLRLRGGILTAFAVTHEPVLQECLTLGGRHQAADALAAEQLDVVGESRNAQHVLQHAGQAGVGIGLGTVIAGRNLQRLIRVEDCVVGVGQAAQAYESEVGEIFFLQIGQATFQRGLVRDAERP